MLSENMVLSPAMVSAAMTRRRVDGWRRREKIV